MKQIYVIFGRLKKPSVLLSIASQVVSILVLSHVQIDKNQAMAIATIVCSLLVALGILSNPDTQKKGYSDDILPCSSTGNPEVHVLIAGQMVCTICGSIYNPTKSSSYLETEFISDS